MKKLFFLATAVLVCAGVWADATHTAPATVSYAEKTFLDVANTPGNAGVDNEEYLNYGVQVMNNNYSSWAWFVISSGVWSKSNSAYTLPQGANGFCTPGTSSSSEFYGQINFKANDNSKTGQIDMYVTGFTEVGFVWKNNNTSNNRWMNYSVTEVASDGTLGTPRLKNGSTSSTDIQYDSIQGLEGTKYYKISMWTTGGSSSLVNTFTFKRYVAPSCNDPEAVLTLSKTAMFVNEEADLTFTTNSTGFWTSEVTLNGETAELGTDYNMTGDPFSLPLAVKVIPLKAGTFEITMTQEAWDGYCAVEEKVTAEVSEANPVTAVTVDGPTAAYVGTELTYTATAEGATAYQWLVDGVKQGSDSAKLIYTAVKGNHSIVCKARNEFNAENVWIVSEPFALKVTSLQGEIIKATLTSGTAATVTGLVGGTADVSLSSKQKMDKGKYCGITLANGAFQEGDTVVIVMTTAGSNYPCLFGDKEKTKLLYLATETSSALEYKIVLPAEANGLTSLYLVRDEDDATYKWNPVLASMAVIRPKAVDHVDVALVGATVNEVALGEEDITTLLTSKELNIATSYVDAPTVTFVKHSDIYYEGESEPVSKNENIEVIATEVAGAWQAQATIGDETYTITLAKTASFTVHYMDGENELGTENVEANGSVAKYADFQSKTLATFVGWYQNVDLTIEAVLTAPIIAETYLYAKFENKYAASINIEQAILANGKGEAKSKALLSQLGTLNYASNITYSEKNNELDSLNNAKDIRNYDYLGLKVKASGAMLDFRLAAGKTVKIKFGKVNTTPKVAINGGAKADMTLVDAANGCKTYTYTAEEDTYISISTADGTALVFKQIMIDEDLKEVVLPALYTVTYNAGDGTCAVAKAETQFAGDKVVLPTVTPAENYEFDGWYDAATDGTKVGVAGAEYAPTANITLFAYYTPAGGGSAINNTDAEVKAVKVIRNGQLIIIRDGKEFNVLGTAVK